MKKWWRQLVYLTVVAVAAGVFTFQGLIYWSDVAERHAKDELTERLNATNFSSVPVRRACDEHRDETFLGSFAGHVAIYRGNPDHCGDLVEITDILVSNLPSFELENLRRGVPYAGQGELLQLLEGLRSYGETAEPG